MELIQAITLEPVKNNKRLSTRPQNCRLYRELQSYNYHGMGSNLWHDNKSPFPSLTQSKQSRQYIPRT